MPCWVVLAFAAFLAGRGRLHRFGDRPSETQKRLLLAVGSRANTYRAGDYVRRIVKTFKLAVGAPNRSPSDGDAPPPAQVTREDMNIVQLGRDPKVRLIAWKLRLGRD